MLAAPFKVVLDANVLYRFTPRDTLLRAASEGFFQIYWSADAVRPLEVVDTRGDDGRPSLDVREAEIEQLYNVQDMYSRLFVHRALP